MKKKILLLVFALVMALTLTFALASCNSSETPTEKPTEKPTEQSCIHIYDSSCDTDCNLCGETREASHTEAKLEAVDPTCTETGLTEGSYCAVCDEVITAQKTVPAKGHVEVTDPSKLATCTETGLTQGSHCEICGETIVAQNVVEKIAHLGGDIIPGVKATCTQEGLTQGEKCLVCGEIIVEQTVLEPLGHNEVSISEVAATCTTPGATEGVKCERCEEILVKPTVIEALGHTFSDKYSFDAEGHWKVCSVRMCGAKTQKEAHDMYHYSCKVCDYYNGPQVDTLSDYANSSAKSLDELFMAYDQIAGTKIGVSVDSISNITIPMGENVRLNGWVGFAGLEIQGFGYWFNDDVYTVKINDSFFIETEDAVLEAGGEYARRFSILANTNVAEDVTSISFVALLKNGTYVVLKELNVVLTGEGLEPGEIIPDDKIVKAEAETLGYISKLVANKTSSGFRTAAGLEYTAIGGTFLNTGKFTINKTDSFKVTFAENYDRFAENFNKYKISYSSTTPLKATVVYTDGEELVSDIVYLEAGDNMFSCLTLGYVKGIYAKNISSIEFQILGSENQATFVLYDVVTEDVDVINGSITYLVNNRYALGVNIKWGGGISFILDKEDNNSEISNLINCADTGRLVQQSYYGTKTQGDNGYELGEFHDNAWGYNPVQGGNKYNEPSRIIDVQISGTSIYVKAQPRDWAQHHLTSSYMENVYTLYSDRIQVDNIFTDFSGFASNPKTSQELPAFYTIGYLNTFAYYGGANPWTNGDVTYDNDLGFWTEDYNATKKLKEGNTETWCAWINETDDYGIGLYTPNIKELFAGRLGYDESPDEVESTAQACSYVAAIGYLRLANYEPMEYSYLITTGSTQEIRDLFTEHKDFANNADLTDPMFTE